MEEDVPDLPENRDMEEDLELREADFVVELLTPRPSNQPR